MQALWPSQSKQRKGVQSRQYLTVRKNFRSPAQELLWNLCLKVIQSVFNSSSLPSTVRFEDLDGSVLPGAPYTALAITHSFSGSPHIDTDDTTYQHVIALGECEGGRLCVDHDGIESENPCTRIDVRVRSGRLDGRIVHWVEGWKGERFSVVYYSTDPMHNTKPVDQSIHNLWMTQGCQQRERP